MPIELMTVRPRKAVAWLSDVPPSPAVLALQEREYIVTSCTGRELHDHSFLCGLSAVVFTPTDKILQLSRNLRYYARTLLDYDCHVIIIQSGQTGLNSIINVLNEKRLPAAGLPARLQTVRSSQDPLEAGDPPHPYVRYFDASVPWSAVANFISRCPAGPAPNQTLKICVDGPQRTKLDETSRLLLKRAFWDCSEVHLAPLEEGRSGAGVFRAYAELQAGLHGQWPHPHFVKIGPRSKIFSEYLTYEQKVRPYVPFHLGPHLLRERCCLGAIKGILVGDYVDESESLHGCAFDGRSAAAIACLFDRTLAGWHRQAQETDVTIATSLARKFSKHITENRLAKAKSLGAKLELQDLRNLFAQCTTVPVLIGPVHGDLHASNVRVRNTDAIVIDFFAHRTNEPLLYDAAFLEASLLIEGFRRSTDDLQTWFKTLSVLYDHPPLHATVKHISPKNPCFWFHMCVQQIRRYARQWERQPNQYAGALAIALLQKATKENNAPDDEALRRAAAYVFAEHILASSFQI